jgi:molybdopterin-guanine dinucleotide biosynthesis protein B
MPMPIIAVVGSRQSGKTTTVEAIVRGLTLKGYRVATAKRIPEADFTIDTKEKDTWRHAQAGAKTILSVAPKELTIIKKVDTTRYGLSALVEQCEKEADILILEGFRKLVAKDLSIPKVVTVKTVKEASEASKYFKPILAFAGSAKVEVEVLKIPKIDVLKEPQKLVEVVSKRVGPIIEKRRTLKETLNIQVDEKTLPLNPFVKKFVRNVILAMVSTLKETRIRGDENISIAIEKQHKDVQIN